MKHNRAVFAIASTNNTVASLACTKLEARD